MKLQITKIEIASQLDVVKARQRAKQVAKLTGFDSQDQTRIATAVSEIARNAFEYAKRGIVSIYLLDERPQRLFIEISDKGKGISNLQEILDGRYVSPTGMGVGLIGARKLLDFFSVDSDPENGTTVTLGKNRPKGQLPVTKDALHKIIDELTKFTAGDPIEEMRQQNHELVEALTQLREKQEELQILNHELENTNRGVVALYSELDEKAQALQTANQVKTRFLSNVTHEFRTPVNSIVNMTRILLDGFDGELSETQKKSVQIVSRSARTLSDMVNDLLDLAKVEAGKVVLRPQEFSMSEMFGALNGLFKPLLANNSNVRLIIEEPENEIILVTDEDKFSQVLRNLISNALKFTERGEVRVTAEKTSDGQVKVLVSDTGIGIATKDLNYVFDEFVQIESPLQKQNKGTGLGLPLTRKLVSLLGGIVTVESQSGLGSTFCVTVPSQYIGPLEGVYVSQEKKDDFKSRWRILIVDDDESDRSRLSQILEKNLSCEIIQATNGEDGIRLNSKEKMDLVFLDLVMPEMSGWEVLEKIRTGSSNNLVPVLLHTTQILSGTELEKLTQQQAQFLPKMASEGEKLNSIKSLMRDRRRQVGKEKSNVERNH